MDEARKYLLHSALHRIQTVDAVRDVPQAHPLHSALHRFQTELAHGAHRQYKRCTPLFIAFKPEAKEMLKHIRDMLHSALHRFQTWGLLNRGYLKKERCTPLFIAFKQGGLLRSFSKRGEHTASERGMHLEC